MPTEPDCAQLSARATGGAVHPIDGRVSALNSQADPIQRRLAQMVLAADYPFMDVFWSMIIFFFWVVWIWIVVHRAHRHLPS